MSGTSKMRRLLLTAALTFITSAASAQMPLLGFGKGSFTQPVAGAMTSPIMTSGSTGAPSTSAVNYGKFSAGFTNNIWGATAAAQENVWPVAGTISNLEVYFPTQPGNTNASYDVGLVLAGTKQTLVCNVAFNSNSCTDSGHTITVAAGNLVGWFVCPSNTATCTAGNAPTAQAGPV